MTVMNVLHNGLFYGGHRFMVTSYPPQPLASTQSGRVLYETNIIKEKKAIVYTI